jgi:hypothetical protein
MTRHVPTSTIEHRTCARCGALCTPSGTERHPTWVHEDTTQIGHCTGRPVIQPTWKRKP